MTPRRLICELVVKFDNSIFIVRSLIVTGQYKRINHSQSLLSRSLQSRDDDLYICTL